MKREMYLADTTVWAHYLRGDNPELRERLATLVMAGRLATADIVIMEILRCARSEQAYETLYRDFTALPRLEMSAAVWERAWKAGFVLRGKGITVPLADTLIAAIAVEHSHTLLHADRHFPLLAGAIGLKEELVGAGNSPG